MRKCYRCGHYYGAEAGRCNECDTRLTLLDTLRTWRRLRRLLGRYQPRRAPEVDDPAEPRSAVARQ